MAVRAQVVVRGIVQGVGFRPFVYRLAREHRLAGWVLNSTQGVVVEIEGERGRIDRFLAGLTASPPPQALIERVETNLLPPIGYSSFVIEASREGDEFVLISPDICICADCLRELRDPQDRRHAYPFSNCTNCGPRFTIISDIPYDRPKTTMRAFAMCPRCDREYHDPGDRRFHAQPNACPVCGPQVELMGNGDRLGETTPQAEAVDTARRLLAEGEIVAVKGLGGFHLACDATNPRAVATLRERKRRVDKPFAVMSLDVKTVRRYCEVSEGEAQLLEVPARPIVLLRRRPDSPIAREVAPGNNYTGVMLPYTPLHYLLLEGTGRNGAELPLALVMTSGNLSEEPIATGNEEALERLGHLADYFLLHNRDIYVRCDDSVTRLFRGQEAIMRRSRGYAPFPVRLNLELEEVLACGAELKNTFCLTKGTYAFLSQHIGDMENYETYESYRSAVEHFRRLFRVEPRAVAHDLHPNYLATRYALELAEAEGLRKVGIQHHHAHVVSCMAENGVSDKVIGVAFDGTGYGSDGHIWGGEFLLADYRRFRRLAHFKYVPLPGGEAAIRRPYRMAVSHLLSAFGEEALDLPLELWSRVYPAELALIRRMMAARVNSPLTSSCGRLFDAVSALLGVRGVVNYEGQAAIELEMLAAEGVDEAYDWDRSSAYPMIIDPAPLLRGVVSDLMRGVDAGVISAKFHNTIAVIIAAVSETARQRTGVGKVALSGGVFQNVYLLGRTLDELERRGFETLIHHQVPANDGGIALGQAVIASAKGGSARPSRRKGS
ncbi:MAG: carbamoyltransferase HypF [Dehalococcoidia bacterium]|nr:MAG: carbamoyltransferase HypF [Dehalococcoidia bacterium]